MLIWRLGREGVGYAIGRVWVTKRRIVFAGVVVDGDDAQEDDGTDDTHLATRAKDQVEPEGETGVAIARRPERVVAARAGPVLGHAGP